MSRENEHYNEGTQLALLCREVQDTGRKVDEMHQVMFHGQGDSEPWTVRIDRLEESERDRTKRENRRLAMLWAAIVSSLSGLFHAVFLR